MIKVFKKIPEITVITQIEHLTYGVAEENKKHYIYIRKPIGQWKKRHGPFPNRMRAELEINQIKEEYNAVRVKQNRARL